jgi:hypothetical protein
MSMAMRLTNGPNGKLRTRDLHRDHTEKSFKTNISLISQVSCPVLRPNPIKLVWHMTTTHHAMTDHRMAKMVKELYKKLSDEADVDAWRKTSMHYLNVWRWTMSRIQAEIQALNSNVIPCGGHMPKPVRQMPFMNGNV